MALADILSAAKPAVGAPPFSPMPNVGAGGAQIPTTAGNLPVKRGFSGFLDRFINPTSALGQFGRALVMAGGTPLGDAFAIMDRQRRDLGDQELDNAYKRAQIAHLTAPEAPHVGALQQKINDLRANGATDEQIRSLVSAETSPMAAVQVTDPATGATSLQFYPKGGMPGALGIAPQQQPSGPPAGAVEMLRKNPGLAPQFDQKYGPGASSQYLGGGAAQASAPFLR